MKAFKILFFIFFLASAADAVAQHLDTIVNMGNYKSYYSYEVKNPLYVTYALKSGGGGCKRTHFRFHSCGLNTATAADYARSGFDEGHLADAEDFAYDCSLDQNTFCFFNCLPQTPRLNRGIWKKWETRIRKLSQSQELFIIAGGIYHSKIIKPGSSVIVPDYCYKIVLTASGKLLYCLLFPNDYTSTVRSLTVKELKSLLLYDLVF